jgi:hypothetical protein
MVTANGVLLASYAREVALRFRHGSELVGAWRKSVRIPHRRRHSEKVILGMEEY